MMNNAVKAALLSGVVFPGLGQIFLKQYKSGIILIAAVTAVMIVIAVKAAQHALIILEKIQAAGGVIDIQTITAAATQATTTSDSRVYNLGLLFLLLCWIFGILDAYRVGKQMR